MHFMMKQIRVFNVGGKSKGQINKISHYSLHLGVRVASDRGQHTEAQGPNPVYLPPVCVAH